MSSAKNGCANFFRLYNSEHKIVTMLTSHYMQDIEELCDRVIIIDHGKIFFDGPLNSIIDRFSGYKIISLTFQTPSERDFSLLGEVLQQTPVSVQLKVPRAKVTETCRQVLGGMRRDRYQRAGIAGRRSDPPIIRRARHLARRSAAKRGRGTFG